MTVCGFATTDPIMVLSYTTSHVTFTFVIFSSASASPSALLLVNSNCSISASITPMMDNLCVLRNCHFFKYSFILHRLENRTKPISTPRDGRRQWDPNLRTSTCESPALTTVLWTLTLFIYWCKNVLTTAPIVFLGFRSGWSIDDQTYLDTFCCCTVVCNANSYTLLYMLWILWSHIYFHMYVCMYVCMYECMNVWRVRVPPGPKLGGYNSADLFRRIWII